MESLKIESSKEENHLLIALEGELDASSALLLDNALAEALKDGNKTILIDGARLSYISSAGLGVFMSYLRDFEEQKVEMVIFNLTEKVKKVFEILGLDALLKIVETKETALSLLK